MCWRLSGVWLRWWRLETIENSLRQRNALAHQLDFESCQGSLQVKRSNRVRWLQNQVVPELWWNIHVTERSHPLSWLSKIVQKQLELHLHNPTPGGDHSNQFQLLQRRTPWVFYWENENRFWKTDWLRPGSSVSDPAIHFFLYFLDSS